MRNNRLKFSANLSMLFTEVDLIDRFQAAKNAGFSAVEIQFPYSLPPEIIAEKLRENGLTLVLFNVDAGDLLQGGEGLACVPEKQWQFEAALEQAVEYAQILKPAAVNILPGRCLHPNKSSNKSILPMPFGFAQESVRQAFMPRRVHHERNQLTTVRLYTPEGTEPVEGLNDGFSCTLQEYLGTFKNNLRLAADAFAPLGVKAVFEAINTFDMPGFIVHSGVQMLAVLAELNHPNLYMQYDIYHMTRMGEDCAGFIQNHAGQISHIQLADLPGRGQPGTGEIDFAALFDVISRSGYQGWCGAEYRPVGLSNISFGWLKKIKS